MNPKQEYKVPQPNKTGSVPPEFVRTQSAPPEGKEAALGALRSKVPNLTANSQNFQSNSQKVPKNIYNITYF